MQVDGHTVHYVDEGSGPTLLLLHGNPTWSFLWRQVIPGLSGHFRCVALDYPGFGLSTPAHDYRYMPEEHADVVGGFVDALGLKDITLVGQDWGGMIGLAAAEQRPETFNRLVLANTWAWPVNGTFHFEWFGRVIGGMPFRFLVRRLNVLVDWFMPVGHKQRQLSKDEMDHYRRALGTAARRQASAVLPGQILASKKFFADVETGLPAISELPTLIIWGEKDIAFRPKERDRLYETFPNNDLVTLASAGLYTESDSPEEFVDALIGWEPLKQAAAPTRRRS
ncbi:MAG: alpha/beta fold hydrolase [Brachybacterium sp.]|nr:alpha/beta fold hydrolase [Brachybacterium sp.]